MIASLTEAARALDLIDSTETIEQLRRLAASAADLREQMAAFAVIARATKEAVQRDADAARASHALALADVAETEQIARQLATDLAKKPAASSSPTEPVSGHQSQTPVKPPEAALPSPASAPTVTTHASPPAIPSDRDRLLEEALTVEAEEAGEESDPTTLASAAGMPMAATPSGARTRPSTEPPVANGKPAPRRRRGGPSASAKA